jgi:hypothetical protein
MKFLTSIEYIIEAKDEEEALDNLYRHLEGEIITPHPLFADEYAKELSDAEAWMIVEKREAA